MTDPEVRPVPGGVTLRVRVCPREALRRAVPRRSITIEAGETGRMKRIRIEGASVESVLEGAMKPGSR